MDALAFEHHLTSPQGLGHVPDGASTVTTSGGSCCDELTFSVSVDGDAGHRRRLHRPRLRRGHRRRQRRGHARSRT